MDLEIPKLLLYHRKKGGLTQSRLARLAGVGKTAVFDIEHGKQTVQCDTLFKILNALNIRLEFTSPLMKLYLEEKR